MKLYHSPMSPFVRKVMVLLFETGQLSDVEIVPVTTTPITPMAGLLAKIHLLKFLRWNATMRPHSMTAVLFAHSLTQGQGISSIHLAQGSGKP